MQMTNYLLSIYQPDGDPPPRELLEPVMRKMNALIQEAKAAGVWVFNGGLHAPSTASVVRLKNNDIVTTDGPYVETKEHIGGFMIVNVADLDAALQWASKMARGLVLPGFDSGLPVEVRPFNYTDGVG
jgi:hypothetical protein